MEPDEKQEDENGGEDQWPTGDIKYSDYPPTAAARPVRGGRL